MHKLAQMDTPVFWAEGHPGSLDKDTWQLEIGGKCTNPAVFSMQELLNMPKSIAQGRLTSVTRWSVYGAWGGVLLADLFKIVKPLPSVRYVRFWSYGMVYDTSIPLEIAMLDKSLMAWDFDGEDLTEDYGCPLRAFIPYLWGYKSAKSVVKIELLERYQSGFWEQRGYTDSGEIKAGPCRDINDGGKIKFIHDGEVLAFANPQ